jgi:hypothetical protein
MAKGERNRTEREVLLWRQEQPLASLEELMEACLPTLSARLWATCCWGRTMAEGWKIGDYNFLIAEVRPDSESNLYVQFWSEPHEPVAVEVCSGEWNPGAIKYVRQRQREMLEGLGYQVGGRARNLQKEARILSAAEAETAAREVLSIFFDVFDYRGQWPLELERHQGQRADLKQTYSSVTPEDFAKLAAHFGYAVESCSGERPLYVLRRGRKQFTVSFGARVPDNSLYAVVALNTLVESKRAITDAMLARVAYDAQFCRFSRHGSQSLALTMPLRLDGGVTADWIANAFEHFFAAWRDCERVLRARRTVPPVPPKVRGSNDKRLH